MGFPWEWECTLWAYDTKNDTSLARNKYYKLDVHEPILLCQQAHITLKTHLHYHLIIDATLHWQNSSLYVTERFQKGIITSCRLLPTCSTFTKSVTVSASIALLTSGHRMFSKGRIADLSPLSAANGFVRPWFHLAHGSLDPHESAHKRHLWQWVWMEKLFLKFYVQYRPTLRHYGS